MKIFLFPMTIMILIGITACPLWSADLLHEKSLSTKAGKELTLESPIGDVVIIAWDKSEVGVRVYGNTKAVEKLKFEFNSTADGVRIITEAKSKKWFKDDFDGVQVRYEINVPAEYNTNVSTAGGNIDLTGVNGNADFSTAGGNITLARAKGRFDLSTAGGDIRVEDTTGEFDAGTAGGNITCVDFSGPIDASTAGGHVTISSRDGRIEAETMGGDMKVRYEGANHGISVKSMGGDIMIEVPADFQATLELDTFGGDIDCELPLSGKNSKDSAELAGNVNGGGNLLECATMGGDIEIRVIKK